MIVLKKIIRPIIFAASYTGLGFIELYAARAGMPVWELAFFDTFCLVGGSIWLAL